ncbi:MAG: alpha/beta hydrolase [Chloroflexota bacterium]|nr:alpha/beta hydrolase [Chloroflexota bacterium]
MELEETLFILVHDGWHGAWAWEGVINWIQERGGTALALNLPGHGSLYRPEETAGDYTLAGYAAAVAAFGRAAKKPDQNMVLVGHGMAGPIMQLAAEELAGELVKLIFVGAYVLDNGETIAEQMPTEMAQFFQQLAESRPDKRIALDLLEEYWRFNVINDDLKRASEVLARLIPEPSGPLFEPITLQTDQPPISCSYLSFNEDLSLPSGSFHPRMAGKLGHHRHMTINAGHEGILTKPREVAEALIFLGLN